MGYKTNSTGRKYSSIQEIIESQNLKQDIMNLYEANLDQHFQPKRHPAPPGDQEEN